MVGLAVFAALGLAAIVVSFHIRRVISTQGNPELSVAAGYIARARAAQRTGDPLEHAPKFVERALYWNEPCVDTTHMALNVLRRTHEMDPSVSTDAFLDAERRRIESFILGHMNYGLGGYGQHARARPSTYACYCAIAALVSLHIGPRPNGRYVREPLEEVVGQEPLEQAVAFVSNCRREGGAFADRELATPTVTATDAGTSTLGALLPPSRKGDPPWTQDGFLWKCYRDSPDGGAFQESPRPAGEAYACATFYATRTLTNTRKYAETERQRLHQVARFLKNCSAPTGGYGIKPKMPGAVEFTEMCVEGLLRLSSLKLGVEPEVNWPGTREFVLESAVDGLYGYDEQMGPNIHATRAAIRVLKRCSEAGVGKADKRWLKRIHDYTISLYDRATGGFAGYGL